MHHQDPTVTNHSGDRSLRHQAETVHQCGKGLDQWNIEHGNVIGRQFDPYVLHVDTVEICALTRQKILKLYLEEAASV